MFKEKISMHENGKAVGLLMVALLALSLTTGCASKTRTYKETRTMTTHPGASQDGASVSSTSSSESTTTVERTETAGESRPQGILSGAVHLVGQIIAFPFKLIGGILGVIF